MRGFEAAENSARRGIENLDYVAFNLTENARFSITKYLIYIHIKCTETWKVLWRKKLLWSDSCCSRSAGFRAAWIYTPSSRWPWSQVETPGQDAAQVNIGSTRILEGKKNLNYRKKDDKNITALYKCIANGKVLHSESLLAPRRNHCPCDY